MGFLRNKHKRSGSISSSATTTSYRFVFTINVHSLSPWPLHYGDLLLEWERGSKRRGQSKATGPGRLLGNDGTTYDFEACFRVPCTLYQVVDKASGSALGVAKKALVLNLVSAAAAGMGGIRERAASAARHVRGGSISSKVAPGARLGSVVINLADFGAGPSEFRMELPVACSKSITNEVGGQQSVLDVTIRRSDRGKALGSDDDSSSMPGSRGPGSMISDTTGTGSATDSRRGGAHSRAMSYDSATFISAQQQQQQQRRLAGGVGDMGHMGGVGSGAQGGGPGPGPRPVDEDGFLEDHDVDEGGGEDTILGTANSIGSAYRSAAGGGNGGAAAGDRGSPLRGHSRMTASAPASAFPASAFANASEGLMRPPDSPGPSHRRAMSAMSITELHPIQSGVPLDDISLDVPVRAASRRWVKPQRGSGSGGGGSGGGSGGGGSHSRNSSFASIPSEDEDDDDASNGSPGTAAAAASPSLAARDNARDEARALGSAAAALRASQQQAGESAGGGFEAAGPSSSGGSSSQQQQQQQQQVVPTGKRTWRRPEPDPPSPPQQQQRRQREGAAAAVPRLATATAAGGSPSPRRNGAASYASVADPSPRSIHSSLGGGGGSFSSSYATAADVDNRDDDEDRDDEARMALEESGLTGAATTADVDRDDEATMEAVLQELRTAAAIEASIHLVRKQDLKRFARLSGPWAYAPARRLARTVITLGAEEGVVFGLKALRAMEAEAKGCLGPSGITTAAFWWSNCLQLRWMLWAVCGGGDQSPRPAADSTNGPASSAVRTAGAGEALAGFHSILAVLVPRLQALEASIFRDTADVLWTQVVVPAAATASQDLLLRTREASQLGSQNELAARRWELGLQASADSLRPLGGAGADPLGGTHTPSYAAAAAAGASPAAMHLRLLRSALLADLLGRLDDVLMEELTADKDGHLAGAAPNFGDGLLPPQLLPFRVTQLTFGEGVSLKIALTRWQDWSRSQGIDWHGLFPKLRAAADLLMFPKDMLAHEQARNEILPALTQHEICDVLAKFVPDDFAPDDVPRGLLSTLRAGAGPRPKRPPSTAANGSSNNPTASAARVENYFGAGANGSSNCPTAATAVGSYSPLPESALLERGLVQAVSLDMDDESDGELDGLERLYAVPGVTGEQPVRFRLLRELWASAR